MDFFAAAETNVGISKSTNQDSVCIKIADTDFGKIAMALMCDGMGGLEKGEVASAAVVNEFCNWFQNDLPHNLSNFSWDYVSEKWTHMIKRLNRAVGDYGRCFGVSLGTTVTAALLFNGEYIIAHVGDSRAYEVKDRLIQLTEDHSVVGREVKQGIITADQAELDPRRNVLLQCVGASKTVNPQIIKGRLKNDTNYLLCSDGFRHVVSPQEILGALNPEAASGSAEMSAGLKSLIDMAMQRGERDNISALLINVRM